MTDEDRTAAKLIGYNCMIKFIDGEELLLKIDDTDNNWFYHAEKFLNDDGSGESFPDTSIAIRRQAVKYIKAI